MLKYISKRIFVFIPTLFVISLMAFVISINSPGDPVESLYSGVKEKPGTFNANTSHEKQLLRHRLGLDLPVFYFTIGSLASPDTIYKVFDSNKKNAIERLIDQYGNWNSINAWLKALESITKKINSVAPDSVAYAQQGIEITNQHVDEARQEIYALSVCYEEVVISSKLSKLQKMMEAESSLGNHSPLYFLNKALPSCRQSFEDMKVNSSQWKNWIPCIRFYGYNQYHRWIFGDGNWLTGKGWGNTEGIIRGDFGTSFATKQAVTKTITRAIPWSLFFTIMSVFLAYLISIPIGIRAAEKRGSVFDHGSSVVLFMLYSTAIFFMATLLLLLFANPAVFNIFPANGVKPATGYPDGISLWGKFKITLPYLILPLACYTYSSFAFLSRTMRVSMLEVISQDYIRTAKAKGLSNYLVIYKHALRNALLPIITVFANIFPAAVGGAVIIEVIFGIPGMGQEIFQAISSKDYPMIVCVFSLSGFLTLIGYLVADILYAVVDPRITYSK